MSNAKKLKQRHLSVRDLEVQKFERNKEKISELMAENNVIKDRWQHSGSFSTRNHIVTVGQRSETRVLSKADGVALYGKAFFKYCVSRKKWFYKVEEK